MTLALSPLDRALIAAWQRGLPLSPRPFAEIGSALGVTEAEVLARLNALRAAGGLARVGGTCRPNTAAASTLAALEVPEERLEAVAARMTAEPGVNHAYLRENALNLWCVVTAPDAAALEASLARIAGETGLEVFDLRLEQPFTIDLGFPLDGPRQAASPPPPADPAALRPGDCDILQALSAGLALVPAPYAALARQLSRGEAEVTARIAALLAAGLVTRLGLIVNHRALGWRANAMVVWDLPEARIEAAGRRLAGHPGVTLCYRRRTVPGRWPYALYCMIHGRSRAETLGVLGAARSLPELAGAGHQVLFSTRCYKQTGALIAHGGARAA